jgi:alanine racemase
VDLDAIAGNVRGLRSMLPPQTAFMAVVKADAYGHGAVPVAQAAVDAGASWLGVATADEALELRAAGIQSRALILGPVAPAWFRECVAAGCSLTVSDADMLEALARVRGDGQPRVHIKMDTGMTRLGATLEGLPALLSAAAASKIIVEGVFTHLACADDPASVVTRQQLDTFGQAIEIVRARYPGVLCHAAASAAILGHPDAAFDMVRAGIALYGVPPAPHLRAPGLRAAMTVMSRVVRTLRVGVGTPVSYGATYRARRPTTIATVPVGYADGYPRALSNTGAMVVGGQRFPVAGRVCMDYTMLDVGDAQVRAGDDVTVFGRGGIPVEELAATAGTIAHELLCRVGRRVPRIYLPTVTARPR